MFSHSSLDHKYIEISVFSRPFSNKNKLPGQNLALEFYYVAKVYKRLATIVRYILLRIYLPSFPPKVQSEFVCHLAYFSSAQANSSAIAKYSSTVLVPRLQINIAKSRFPSRFCSAAIDISCNLFLSEYIQQHLKLKVRVYVLSYLYHCFTLQLSVFVCYLKSLSPSLGQLHFEGLGAHVIPQIQRLLWQYTCKRYSTYYDAN